jgi:hypothetical protein
MDDNWLPLAASVVVLLRVPCGRAHALVRSACFISALRSELTLAHGSGRVQLVDCTLAVEAHRLPHMPELVATCVFVVPSVPAYARVCELAQLFHALVSAVDISARPQVTFSVGLSYSAQMRWEERHG